MTRRLHLILGDHPTRDPNALRDLDSGRDVVLMAEVRAEGVYVPHHRQKIALTLLAMRDFAETLRAEGGRRLHRAG